MNQPLFYTRKLTRLPEFTLDTSVVMKHGKKVVLKRASTPEANDHLQKMVATYQLLVKSKIAKKIHIVEAAKMSDDSVEFEFIDGTSIERRIFDAIVDCKLEDAIAEFNKVFDLVEQLETDSTDAVGDLEKSIFVNKDATFKKQLSTGLVDLNLDNILVDKKNDLHLFDYEWCFGNGVPAEYVQLRILWFFFHRHKEAMKYASNKVPMVKVDNFLILPKAIHEAFEPLFKHMKSFLKTELAFQNHVSGKDDATLLFAAKQPEKVAPYIQKQLGIERILTSNQENAEKVARLESRVKELKKAHNSIVQSRSYKLANSLSTARKRLGL